MKIKKIILFLGGNMGPSYCTEGKDELGTPVDNYIVSFQEKDQGNIKNIFTPETNHQLFVIYKKSGKVTSVLLYEGEGYALQNEHLIEECKRLEGILTILWHCEDEPEGYHMFCINTQEGICQNVRFEAFGYKQEEVFSMMSTIISAPFLGCSGDAVQPLGLIKVPADNSEQVNEILERKE